MRVDFHKLLLNDKIRAQEPVYSVQRDSHRNDYRAVNYSQVP